ncbi:MAG TPA: EamA family transporter [Clostridia bacterium]|nr:EamA family transporter [Clostridia bacterium]
MEAKDKLLALLMVIVWGANFTIIKLGLGGIPSMLLVAVRYLLVFFPAIFFVKKPASSWKYIIAYGFTVGVGQFSCLFYALEIGMPAGLASIIVQLQGFIAPFLSALFLDEKLSAKQLVGFFVAALGLVLIGLASSSQGVTSIPFSAFLLTIGAALFWSVSNIISKSASIEAKKEGKQLDMFALVVWSSLIPPLPMFGLSLLINTPSLIISSLSTLSLMSVFSVLYLAYASTLFAYKVWNDLISKYPMAKVSPISLLIPIFALLVSQLILSEELSKMQWLGVVVILAGLLISNLTPKKRPSPPKP